MRGALRRRGPPPAHAGSDTGRGFTTEEDTGLSDDPREESAPEAKTALTNEGGDKLLTRLKMKKMTVRAVMGTTMMVSFASVIYLGHLYVCALVFALQCFIFSELVGVRKKQAAERRLPLFRSIQWAWFFVAAFFTWSGSICEFLLNSPKFTVLNESWPSLTRLLLEKNMMVSFSLYTGMMIFSVLSLRKGLYKYQITQYTWTVVTIFLVVFQTQAVFHLVYAGLFWFVLPSSLVICNDIMAYYCGQFFGKRFIKKRFLELSPNKTWEGFLGSAVFTLIFAYWFSKKLAEHQWMTCVPEGITLAVNSLSCTPAPMYRIQTLRHLTSEGIPGGAKAWDIVAALAPATVTSIGAAEMSMAQLHALCLGLFASFAAPFGGFLSSAIKRAYGIKDFNNLIPGHGGMMDRMDCQFVMFLCTYVHLRTFCQSPVSIDILLASAARLHIGEQQELLRRLQAQVSSLSASA